LVIQEILISLNNKKMKVTRFYILFLIGILIFLTTSAYLMTNKGSSLGLDKIFSTEQLSDTIIAVTNDLGTVKAVDHSTIIKFNHKVHAKDVGVVCKDCHLKASTSTSSKDNLMPNHEACMTCHDVKDDKNCNFCHFDKKEKVPQTRVKLNFNHQYHIEKEKKQCVDCHIGLETVKYAKETPTAFPNMESCITCHNNEKAVNTCAGCHTNLSGLIPKNHKQSNFLNEHKFVTGGLNNSNNKCMMCHSDNFCQVCHSAPKYQGENTKDNFFVPYYTKESATKIDREGLQKLTSVHNLNFKMTHGLDASSKSFECKTCHDPVTFCASCHQNGGEQLTGVVPQSHFQTGFTTLGVNTGGGIHSQLARKDIELCQSCHDVQGSDPVCVRCHTDNDGIKGTHPKTHEPNFLHDERGLWHDTQGAVCYTCHTDANARPNGVSGTGFCGYCHGAKK